MAKSNERPRKPNSKKTSPNGNELIEYKPGTAFPGVLGRTIAESTSAWPQPLRAKPGAPVSAPCTWEEVESGAASPRAFTLRSMAARAASAGDLWQTMLEERQSLKHPIERLKRLLS